MSFRRSGHISNASFSKRIIFLWYLRVIFLHGGEGWQAGFFFFIHTSFSQRRHERTKKGCCHREEPHTALRPPLHIVHLQHIVASPGRCEKSSCEKLEHSFIEAIAHIRCVYHRCFRLFSYGSALLGSVSRYNVKRSRFK